jgi:4-amino-4-deoxy-L-arabinose transferase-like glycosyltransferase
MLKRHLPKYGLGLIILVYIGLNLTYNFITPIWEVPDELHHFQYIQYMAKNYRLPPLSLEPAKLPFPTAFHPPLYYFLLSPFAKNVANKPISFTVNPPGAKCFFSHESEAERFPYQGIPKIVHLLRLFSLVIGILVIFITYKLTLEIFPHKNSIALSASAITAFIPQFIFMTAGLNNENLAILFCSLSIFLLVKLLKNLSASWGNYLALGITLSLSFLSKTSSLFLLPPTCIFLLWKKRFKGVFVVLGTILLLAGWWYFRNWILYGDPLANRVTLMATPWLKPCKQWWFVGNFFFRSFFAYFGITRIPVSKNLYTIFAFLSLGGLLGLVLCRLKKILTQRQNLIIFNLFPTALLAIFLILIYYAITWTAPHGRHSFIALSIISILGVTGLDALLKNKYKNLLPFILTGILIWINLTCLFKYVIPAFDTSIAIDVSQGQADTVVGEIYGANSFGQTFRAKHNNLYRIDILVGTYNRKNHQDVFFHLKKGFPPSLEVVKLSINAGKITEGYYSFTFPPISDSKDSLFYFYLESPNSSPGDAITIYSSVEDCYPEGTKIVNGKPASGDLTFIAYYKKL